MPLRAQPVQELPQPVAGCQEPGGVPFREGLVQDRKEVEQLTKEGNVYALLAKWRDRLSPGLVTEKGMV